MCYKSLPKTTTGEVVAFKGWPRLYWFLAEHLPKPPKDWMPPPRLTDDTPAYLEYTTQQDGSVLGVTVTRAAMLSHARTLTLACNYTEGKIWVHIGTKIMPLKSEKPAEIQLLAWLGLECNVQEFQNFSLNSKTTWIFQILRLSDFWMYFLFLNAFTWWTFWILTGYLLCSGDSFLCFASACEKFSRATFESLWTQRWNPLNPHWHELWK